jgi:putative transposase
LVRLAHLAVSNVFAMVRLLPVGEREKDVEILVLRHQITVLQRQLGSARVQFTPEDRALLAALLTALPRGCAASLAVAGARGHSAAMAS